MKLTDLLKGRIALVMTNMNVEVELEIDKVSEMDMRREVDNEPATVSNGFWPVTHTEGSLSYNVTFTNGSYKEYAKLESIKLKELVEVDYSEKYAALSSNDKYELVTKYLTEVQGEAGTVAFYIYSQMKDDGKLKGFLLKNKLLTNK